jgi:hypothetical protein
MYIPFLRPPRQPSPMRSRASASHCTTPRPPRWYRVSRYIIYPRRMAAAPGRGDPCLWKGPLVPGLALPMANPGRSLLRSILPWPQRLHPTRLTSSGRSRGDLCDLAPPFSLDSDFPGPRPPALPSPVRVCTTLAACTPQRCSVARMAASDHVMDQVYSPCSLWQRSFDHRH